MRRISHRTMYRLAILVTNILIWRFENGRWRTPEVAPFSGRYSDADPFFTPDGSRFYFISNRPVVGKSQPDLDIWMIEKTGAGWSEPKNLDAPVASIAWLSNNFLASLREWRSLGAGEQQR